MDDGNGPGLLGMRHIALFVASERFGPTERFYRDGLGMRVDWQPDPDNVYLSSGTDNLALHRVERSVETRQGPLDHLGFLVRTEGDVHAWHARLSAAAEELQLEIATPVKRHRDGSTSFYLLDPSGVRVQIIHLPAPPEDGGTDV